ncbi:MAG: Trp family transcriptional regulator [Candidatus Woesebacteria bacterium]|nr:Trp family transcriptional regulator [Candidatus Woesebacteria bacterium]
MSQVSKYPVRKDVYDEIFDTFLQTIANLKTKREVLEFFNEFLTPNEKIMFSKRLAAGLLISEGYDYKEISNLLKTSSATISTFSSFYKYGEGYRKLIDKIKTDKEIIEFLRMIGEKISALGTFGGKGSGAWKAINRKLKDKKSKLLQ